MVNDEGVDHFDFSLTCLYCLFWINDVMDEYVCFYWPICTRNRVLIFIFNWQPVHSSFNIAEVLTCCNNWQLLHLCIKKIIEYFESIINTYFSLSHKLWCYSYTSHTIVNITNVFTYIIYYVSLKREYFMHLVHIFPPLI